MASQMLLDYIEILISDMLTNSAGPDQTLVFEEQSD